MGDVFQSLVGHGWLCILFRKFCRHNISNHTLSAEGRHIIPSIGAKLAEDITIDGEALDEEQTYTMAISDYLADGGDKLDMLTRFEYFNTGVLVRDAILAAWRSAEAEGRIVEANRDGRVSRR